MSNSRKSGFAIVKVSEFQGKEATADKNGLSPMYLHPVCGAIPNRNVLSGTVADSQGFKEGESYLAQWNESTPDPTYGTQINWTAVTGEPLKAMEIVEVAQSSLFNGEAGTIFEISDSIAVKATDATTSKAKADKAVAQAG